MPRRSARDDPFYELLQAKDFFDGLTPPSDIILLRHGRFPRNLPIAISDDPTVSELAAIVEATHQSNNKLGLDEVGERQAALVGAALVKFFPEGIQTCRTSPYRRAKEMASLVLPNVAAVIDYNLAERSRGDVQGVPKEYLESYVAQINARLPEDQQYPFDKDVNPLHWWPFDGEPYSLKAQSLRIAMTAMARQAPDQPILASTHGEVVIVGRTVKELGNMGNAELKRGVTPDCPALAVGNGHFDWWTRRNPDTGALSPVFTHLRAINVCSDPALDTGFLRIDTLGRNE